MAMTNRNNMKKDGFILATIDDLVPQDNIVRKLEKTIDFTFIYSKVEHLYSNVGRPSIDPVILFKLLILNVMFNIHSMRETCNRCVTDLAFRWFLGLSIEEKIPDFSTWSQNYIRRYKDSQIFNEIFDYILSVGIRNNFVDASSVFGDGTHIKANANKRKAVIETQEILKKEYEDELLEEINKDREYIGKKGFTSMVKEEIVFDEKTGEEKVVRETKEVKVSTTDSESGMFHKGDKEKCFAYNAQTFCDKHGFVLTSIVLPGNIHDSVAFYPAYYDLMNKFGNSVKNLCLDSAYNTAPICKMILDANQKIFLPYKRPMTKKGYYKKYEYVYDEEYDQYICPNIELLTYTTTTRKGVRQYKSDSEICEKCPIKSKCTNSKNNQKMIERHLWEDYREEANELRYTPEWKEMYPLRKETIERVFAETKENMGMRYTRLRGLKKNQHHVLIVFACHNLKKIAYLKNGPKHKRYKTKSPA